MKRLIAAIADMRAKLAVVEALLRDGQNDRALLELERAEADWRQAMTETAR